MKTREEGHELLINPYLVFLNLCNLRNLRIKFILWQPATKENIIARTSSIQVPFSF